MAQSTIARVCTIGFVCLLFILLLTSCDRTSSPEGRMSIKLENIQREMIDSLKQQNRAILDSLGKIREDLSTIQQQLK
jgi:hypothetical protein